mgnify:CR=1 FL=1
MPDSALHSNRPRSLRRYGVLALPVIAGLLLGLSFPPFDFPLLPWVALVPVGVAWLVRVQQRGSVWAAFAGGALFHLIGLDWIRHCYAGDAMFGPYAGLLLLVALVGGGWFAAAFWWGRRLSHRLHIPMGLLLPIVWAMYEISREVLHLAVDGSCGGWLNLSLTQVGRGNFAQVVDIGGQHTLTLLIAMVNGAIVDVGTLLFRSVHRLPTSHLQSRQAAVVLSLVILGCALGYGSWRSRQHVEHPGPTIALMPKIDLPPVHADSLGRWGFAEQPQLLVWPELAYHHRLVQLPYGHGFRAADGRSELRNPTHEHPLPADTTALAFGRSREEYASAVMQYLQEASHQGGAALLMGCQRLQPGDTQLTRHNSLVFVDNATGGGGVYDKVRLAPWREVTPHGPPADINLQPDQYLPGQHAAVFELSGERGHSYTFGCALCYDVCFAGHFQCVNREAGGRPDFYVHCGSEGQDGGWALSQTMLRMAQLRAIENRRAIVRNAENGYSGIINGNGRYVHRIGPAELESPTELRPIPVEDRFSLYASTGEWLPALICLSAIFLQLRAAATPTTFRRRRHPEHVS